MATDVFGYEKQAKGLQNIASPSMVCVSIDGQINLAQSVQVNYQREVMPVYELGTDSVWMTGAHASGTIDISRAIGEQGMLRPYAQGDACEDRTIVIRKGNGACGMDPGTVTATGSLLTGVGIQLSVQGAVITDSAQYRAASVSIS